jgi:hypothetical protein
MGWIGGVALTILCIVPTWAQVEARRMRHGLEAVGVVIEPVHPDAERRGVSRATLQAGIEAQLQKAGFRVFLLAESENNPGQPLLFLHVKVAPLENLPVYSVAIRLRLQQHACLTRNLIICEPVITWKYLSDIRTLSVSRLSSLPQEVHDTVDRFLNAHQAENLR